MLKSIPIALCRKQTTQLISICNTCTSTFEDDFRKSHIPTTFLQRTVLTIGSAAASLLDPHRGDMIACLSETTGKLIVYYGIVFK